MLDYIAHVHWQLDFLDGSPGARSNFPSYARCFLNLISTSSSDSTLSSPTDWTTEDKGLTNGFHLTNSNLRRTTPDRLEADWFRSRSPNLNSDDYFLS